MGCCGSKAKTPQPHTNLTASKSAPPDEESVVKEVLSETPISKPSPLSSQLHSHSNIFPTTSHPPLPLQTTFSTPLFLFSHQHSNQGPLTPNTNHANILSSHQQPYPPLLTTGVDTLNLHTKEEKTPEVSQTSEISTATTVTEIRDDEVTSKKRVPNALPLKLHRNRPYSGDRLPLPRRERPVNGGVRREVSRGVKRDIGEASGRRSRSPATRVAGGVGKGRGGGSPGKVTGAVGNRLVDKDGEMKDGNGDVSGEEKESESLENPLVSLECFIFL